MHASKDAVKVRHCTTVISPAIAWPVKYIGVGESIDDLQKFDADAFVNALFDVEERS